MRAEHSSLWRRLLILPPVVVGIAVLAWMAQVREPPLQAEPVEPTRTVRVVEAPLVELVPVAEGYGPVQPAKVWTAVSQVAGRVIEIHPRLRNGEILARQTELLRIDPVDYELALAQSQAELAELSVQEQNARASLEIEQRNLDLARRELARNSDLVKQGTVSQSAVDETERTMLATRAAVQNLRNTLSLIPSQRALLQARADRSARDLEYTRIVAPFDMRVANLAVEADQYVGIGQSLFEGDAIERVEIQAQVAMSALRRLFLGRETPTLDLTRLNELLPNLLGLDPLVRLDLGNHIAEWQAEFVRFADTVDLQTRTMGVIVAVDRPFDKVRPGYRPPLSKGMFVQVMLRGRSQAPRVIVPRSAVRGGAVLVADDDGRLRRRPVEVLFSQGQVSVISDGLAAGERVVVSDLVPAVEGMLLQVEVDRDLEAELAAGGRAR